jgi:hypothetical protein
VVAKEDDNVERVRDLSMVTSDASKQAHSGVLGAWKVCIFSIVAS